MNDTAQTLALITGLWALVTTIISILAIGKLNRNTDMADYWKKQSEGWEEIVQRRTGQISELSDEVAKWKHEAHTLTDINENLRKAQPNDSDRMEAAKAIRDLTTMAGRQAKEITDLKKALRNEEQEIEKLEELNRSHVEILKTEKQRRQAAERVCKDRDLEYTGKVTEVRCLEAEKATLKDRLKGWERWLTRIANKLGCVSSRTNIENAINQLMDRLARREDLLQKIETDQTRNQGKLVLKADHIAMDDAFRDWLGDVFERCRDELAKGMVLAIAAKFSEQRRIRMHASVYHAMPITNREAREAVESAGRLNGQPKATEDVKEGQAVTEG